MWHPYHILVALPDLQQTHQVLEADPQGDHSSLDLRRVDLGCYQRLDGQVTQHGQLSDAPSDQVQMSTKMVPSSLLTHDTDTDLMLVSTS